MPNPDTITSPSDSGPDAAARALRGGGVVALPTETVYGLAGDAGNPDAVRRVFEVKGRPGTNPLIVHVADATAARRVVAEWPDAADRLAAAFWPGPLTLVLPRGEGIADAVTAGGGTVAVRVPGHPLTLDVLRRFHALGGVGLAMPSANRSEHVSPTIAQHVRDDLPGVPVLDGGPCGVGIESTVVSLIGTTTLLRPGGISAAEVEAVVGPVAVRGGSDAGTAASPGRQPRHYAPSLPCFAFEAGGEVPDDAAVIDVGGRDPRAYAASLYARLRDAECRAGASQVWVELPPDAPEWAAVRDRLRRATTPAGGPGCG